MHVEHILARLPSIGKAAIDWQGSSAFFDYAEKGTAGVSSSMDNLTSNHRSNTLELLF
jgi:hypothetical protein